METLPINATSPLSAKQGKPFPAESMQKMWRMVLDALRDPVFLHDRNCCITRANWAYASQAGLDFADLIGKPYWQVFPKGTGPLCSCVQTMENPSGPEHDEVVEFDGISYISRSIPVTNARGEYLYSLHIMEDITPIRQSATIIGLGEEKFRLVSEAIVEVFWMADISLERIFYASPGFEKIWGRSRTDLYLNPCIFVDAIHPDDRERVCSDLNAQKMGQAFDHVCRVVKPDGSVRWIWNRGFPVLDDAGHCSRYFGIALDITEHKHTEQALLESEKSYREIFDKASEAMAVHDPQTAQIYDVNQAFCKLYGYTHDEALGLSVAQLSWDESDASQTTALHKILIASDRGSHRFEWRARKKDDTDFWVEVTLTSVTILSQPRVLASVRDITERKQSEEILLLHSNILKNLAEGIHLTRVSDGVIVFTNRQLEIMFGYEPGELIGKHVDVINAFDERSPEAVANAIVRELERAGVWSGEMQYVKKDGTAFWCHANVTTFDHPKFGPVWVSVHNEITAQRRAQNALNDAQRLLRESQSIARIGGWKLNPDSGYLMLTEEVYRLIEHPFDEATDFGICQRYFMAQSLPNVLNSLQSAWHTGKRFKLECRMIARTGREFWGELRCSGRVSDSSGDYLVGTFQDITERKQAEASLLESHRHLEEIQTAMDQAGIAIHWIDADTGRFVYINERCCEMLGYSRAEMLVMGIPDVDPNFPKEKGGFGALTAHLRKQGAGRLETINTHKDGHPIPIETSFHYRESPNGEEKYFIAFVSDISQRKQAEAALQREASQNSAMAALASAMLSTDLSVNALAKVTVQYAKHLTDSEHGFVSILDPSNGDNVTYNLNEMMASDCRVTGEDSKIVFPVDADGRYPDLWGHALNIRHGFYTNAPSRHETARGLPAGGIPLRNFLSMPAIVGDRLVGQLALANASHDYTEEDVEIVRHLTDLFSIALERLRIEETIRQLNQTLEQRVQKETNSNREKDLLLIQQSRLAAMGEMVSNIAHQWRQPLSAVGLILQNIGLDYESNELTGESMKSYVAEAMRDIQQMSATIDDFRNFFLPNKEKQCFLVNDSVKEAIKLVNQSFINNSIGIVHDKSDEACVAFGHPNEFAQVVLNTLTNAKDAILGKGIAGEVRIHAEKGKGLTTISIRDNGGGIPEDILPKVFDPYFTTKEKGTGIGLYMSKMIMDNMGGSLVIRNVAGGAEVRLTLPQA